MEPKEKVKPIESEKVKRKTLAELFVEPCTVLINHCSMHQAFQIPKAGTESSLNPGRPGQRGLKLVYHPGYGLIGFLGGKYFLSPAPNVIVAYE